MKREAVLWILLFVWVLVSGGLAYLHFHDAAVAKRDQAIIQTNRILVERLVVITNEIKELRHADAHEASGVLAARDVLRANTTPAAIQRFYALSSNQ